MLADSITPMRNPPVKRVFSASVIAIRQMSNGKETFNGR